MPHIPAAARACLGLVDATVQRVRDLAEHAPELPMQAIGNALQFSMKAQQRFTDLTIRGDEVISRFRGIPDEPPVWATFDEDVPVTRTDPNPVWIQPAVLDRADNAAEADPVATDTDAGAPPSSVLSPIGVVAADPAIGRTPVKRTVAKKSAVIRTPPRAAEPAPATKVTAAKASGKRAPAKTAAPAKRAAPAPKAPAPSSAPSDPSPASKNSARQLSAFDLAVDPLVSPEPARSED